MGNPDKPQLSQRDAMLAAMGVQVWHLRRSGADARPLEQPVPQARHLADQASEQNIQSHDPLAETKRVLRNAPDEPAPAHVAGAGQASQAAATPASAPQDVATPQIIEFSWVRGETGMLLCELGISEAGLRMAQDIVAFGDWLRGATGKPVHGDFRWPQLVGSSGSPVRAMHVFLDKHLPQRDDAQRWLAIAGDVAEQFTGWQAGLPAQVIELPALFVGPGDAAGKKVIWQSIRADA